MLGLRVNIISQPHNLREAINILIQKNNFLNKYI